MWITSQTLVYLLNKTKSTETKVAFSELVVLTVNCAITVTNNEFVIFVFYKNLCKNK